VVLVANRLAAPSSEHGKGFLAAGFLLSLLLLISLKKMTACRGGVAFVYSLVL
jgi:hypothetical protein